MTGGAKLLANVKAIAMATPGRRLVLAAISLGILAGCAEDPELAAYRQARANAIDRVAVLFESGCVNNADRLSRSAPFFQQNGMALADRTGAARLYFDEERGVFALTDRFRQTTSSGGVNVRTFQGRSCSVGTPFLNLIDAQVVFTTIAARNNLKLSQIENFRTSTEQTVGLQAANFQRPTFFYVGVSLMNVEDEEGAEDTIQIVNLTMVQES